MKTFEGKNYIDGKWAASATGKTLERKNPANFDDLVSIYPSSDKRDVDAAVASSRKSFHTWKKMSMIKRAELFDNFVQLVKRDTKELAELLCRESGKQINESRADVIEGMHMAQYVFGTGRTGVYGEVIASEIEDKDSYLRKKPKGVFAVITPWNFPFAIPLWLMGPSLLAGNTVVFKPSKETPLIGQKIVEMFEEAGFPHGVVNMVHGTGEQSGDPLITNPDIDGILFTGSYNIGARIKQVCAEDGRKLAVCEMGSKSAILVLEDADVNIAVNAAVVSAFKTSGQRCVSAGRIIVHEKVLDEFTERFVKLSERVHFGNPMDEKVFAGPMVNEAGVKRVSIYNDLAKKEAAEVFIDGGRMGGKEYEKGWFMAPFVYKIAHSHTSRVAREEVFGPHVAIIPVKSTEEAIRVYNDTDYGLSMAVITEDYRKARLVRDECDYGLGYVNLPTIGAEVHLPFGGVKRSGTHFPSASALIDAVTHKTAFTINHAREIKMAQGLKSEVK